MQRFVRQVFATLLALAVLASVSSSATGDAAIDQTAKVSVINSGVMRGAAGSDYAAYGLVLRNRSRTRDALDVTVSVKALNSHGRSFTTDQTRITVIPAATDFVVAGYLIWGVPITLGHMETAVHVGKTAPRGRRVPPATHISLSNDGQYIRGSLTNPYKSPLPESATIYGVFLNRKGQIVAAGEQTTLVVVRPRATVPFNISGNFSTSAPVEGVTSARVSIDPCGYGAFTRVCPVVGARRR